MDTPQPSLTMVARTLSCLAIIAGCFHLHAAPVVLITNVPAYGTTDTLRGTVLGANPATQSIAVFIYVPGCGWVNKPFCSPLLTTIQANGSWSANITTSLPGDTTATRVAALLVSNTYSVACQVCVPVLPTNIYAQALAKAVVTRPSPGVRFLSFSGYDWWVKNSGSPVGPGPNYFSDFTNNAWTDTNGWLHLRITHRSNNWQCAEIVSARTFGTGNYRYELNSSVDAINTNATLGLFTWSDDPAFTDREIDVEGGRWENPADTNNAQFVVQPYYAANHLVRYRVPSGVTNTTHVYVWETNRISYEAQSGAFPPTPNTIISSYLFTNAADIPVTGDENVRLNLWLVNGHAPTDGNEVEVIIKSFTFVPLGTAPVVVPGNVRVPATSQFKYDFNVQPDFHYAVQISSNLVQWQQQASILATNATFNFADTNATPKARFYRVVTLP